MFQTRTIKDKYDLVILGGGINGAAIAMDGAGRGLSVLLVEKNDFASGTSSASSKLIHGGLRYLENKQFALVRESLNERETLLNMAGFLVKPMPFILPKVSQRKNWLVGVGLWIYDHLGDRKLIPKSSHINIEPEQGLKSEFTKGFQYYDCQTDDARLVISLIKTASDKGADVRNGFEVLHAENHKDHWQLSLKDHALNKSHQCQAKVVINVTGPWVNQVSKRLFNLTSAFQIRGVRGSHIVIKRSINKAMMLQNADGRICFVIPYLKNYLLIGTTESIHELGRDDIVISHQERQYLLNAINAYFDVPVKQSDIVQEFAGVRPLIEDKHSSSSKLSRESEIEVIEGRNNAPIINVFGGKITTFRCLAESVLKEVTPLLPLVGPSWTKNGKLTGAGLSAEAVKLKMMQWHRWLSDETIERIIFAYGDQCLNIFPQSMKEASAGRHFGAGIYQVEIDYLMQNEWVNDFDDLIWRRSKFGVLLNDEQLKQLNQALQLTLYQRSH